MTDAATLDNPTTVKAYLRPIDAQGLASFAAGGKANPARRGTIFHDAIGDFLTQFPQDLPADPAVELERHGSRHFRQIADYPGLVSFWWPRFRRIAAWIAAQEPAWRTGVTRVVAERNGRPVLAVKAGAAGQLPGLVHDSSASGNTVFIEPQAVIPLGNRLRQLEGQEREAERAVLHELSSLVGEEAPALSQLQQVLTRLDAALARARYGQWLGAVRPELSKEPSAGFELKGSPERGELLLSSPLGNTFLAARWTPLEAVLEEAGKTRKFSHIDALIEQSTGAALPVAALFDWLHGKPGQQQGWNADLGQLAQGRISAQRSKPLPRADLRMVLDRPAP